MVLLAEAGAEVDRESDDGYTALIAAAAKDDVRSASVLLRHGATIQLRSRNGTTALDVARLLKRRAVAQLLADAGRAALLVRAMQEQVVATPPQVGVSVVEGADGQAAVRISVHSRSTPAASPLLAAAYAGDVGAARWLLKVGAVSYTHLTLPTICSV